MYQPSPITIAGHAYDAETIDLLRGVLDDCWSELTETQKISCSRSLIAQRLLQAAASGERDPGALRAKAFDGLSVGDAATS